MKNQLHSNLVAANYLIAANERQERSRWVGHAFRRLTLRAATPLVAARPRSSVAITTDANYTTVDFNING